MLRLWRRWRDVESTPIRNNSTRESVQMVRATSSFIKLFQTTVIDDSRQMVILQCYNANERQTVLRTLHWLTLSGWELSVEKPRAASERASILCGACLYISAATRSGCTQLLQPPHPATNGDPATPFRACHDVIDCVQSVLRVRLTSLKCDCVASVAHILLFGGRHAIAYYYSYSVFHKS